jgi:drug/metabolite transporter (DMT)-like permease
MSGLESPGRCWPERTNRSPRPPAAAAGFVVLVRSVRRLNWCWQGTCISPPSSSVSAGASHNRGIRLLNVPLETLWRSMISSAKPELHSRARNPDVLEERRTALSSFVVFLVAGLAIFLFALSPVTARISVERLDGMNLGLIRIVGTGLLALPVLVVCRLKPPKRLPDWGLLAVSSFGTFAAFPLLFAVGSQSTSAAHVSLVMASMPLFTGLVAAMFDRRLPGRAWWLGAGLAVAGEALMVLARDQSSIATSSVSGDLVVLIGCILCASGSAAGARLTARTGTWAATFWAATLAGLCLAPAAVRRPFRFCSLVLGAGAWRHSPYCATTV